MNLRLFMTSDAVGGVWRYSATLARQLAATGATICLGIVGPPPSREEAAEVSRSGVELAHLEVPLDWLAGGGSAVASARETIRRAAAEWDAQLVQVNQPAYVHPGPDRPTIAAAHSCVETWWRATHGTGVPGEWAWHRHAVRQGLLSANAIIAPSAGFAEALRAAYEIDLPVDVVWNGLPGSAASQVRKQPVLLAAGRAWDESKNFSLLDRAAAKIAWPVRLAGDTVSPDRTSRAAFPNLVPLGQLGRPAMQSELGRASIFVSPSLYEPFGLGILEAAQAGAALLLSDIPTMRELWDGAAVFFDPRDDRALAAEANALIADPPRRSRHAEAARHRAAQLGIEATATALEQVYSRALALEVEA